MADTTEYIVCEMNEDYAHAIAKWKYPPPYETYSFRDDETEFIDIMNGLHFAVIDTIKKDLIGFIAFGPAAQVRIKGKDKIYNDESYTDLALGLRPDLCGKGYGKYLLTAACKYIKELFPEDGVRVTTEYCNIRAIKLYSKMGFKKCHTFRKGFMGKKFIVMIM